MYLCLSTFLESSNTIFPFLTTRSGISSRSDGGAGGSVLGLSLLTVLCDQGVSAMTVGQVVYMTALLSKYDNLSSTCHTHSRSTVVFSNSAQRVFICLEKVCRFARQLTSQRFLYCVPHFLLTKERTRAEKTILLENGENYLLYILITIHLKGIFLFSLR